MCKFSVALISMVTILYHSPIWADSNGIQRQTAIQAPQYEVIDLSANTFSDNRILYVSGKIQNTSFHRIRGYVIVRLQNSENMDIGYVETPVNRNLPIAHNTMGAFEIAVNIEKEPAVRNVSVEFVKKYAY